MADTPITNTTTKPKTKKRKRKAPVKKVGFFKKTASWVWEQGKDLFSIPSLVVGFAAGVYFF